jgi:hypothetical protein
VNSMATQSKRPVRYNLVRSEYVRFGVWRDFTVRKNVSEKQVDVFMDKLAGKHQSSKVMYIRQPVLLRDALHQDLTKVVNKR